MHKITPHLWFDTQAQEAVRFYTSLLPNSRITRESVLHDTPSGDTYMVSFELARQPFQAISAGPLFKFNPSVSFHIKCQTKGEVDALWNRLIDGGMVLMELGSYPFSERYGWLQDRYGLSWQIIYSGETEIKQKIVPALLFVGEVSGKAEQAINFYTSVFPNGKADILACYGKDQQPEKEGTVNHGIFRLFDMEFVALDSALDHQFAFNEAISFMVNCETQAEIDYYWEKLTSNGGEESVCGWLKDPYGVSWQIVPTLMDEMIKTGTRAQIDRVTQAFLKMRKFDLAELNKAFEGK